KRVAPTEAGTVPPTTQAGAVLGTVPYMSPEQVRGEPVDRRSDLFSSGVVLYEALSGRSLFHRDTPSETGYAILHDAPPALPENVPLRLRNIVLRCLEKKPQDRFQSAHDLELELQQIATGGEAVRRRRSGRWPVTMLAVVAAAIAALAFWFVRRESGLRWVHEEAIPRISELIGKGRYSEAFALGAAVEK